MDTKRSILLAITAILFAIGAWPLMFIPLVLMIPTSKELEEKRTAKSNLEDEIEKLKKRVDELERKTNRKKDIK